MARPMLRVPAIRRKIGKLGCPGQGLVLLEPMTTKATPVASGINPTGVTVRTSSSLLFSDIFLAIGVISLLFDSIFVRRDFTSFSNVLFFGGIKKEIF